MPANEEPDPREDRIEARMAECLLLAEDERQAALERWCEAEPEVADEVRRRMAVLEGMGLIAARPPALERLGDFDLFEVLGEGGMGVVHKARQRSLGRFVALKLVRPELLHFGRAHERFRREVEAIARLKHPGIVPVHAVGEERGVPYFAMELVEGCTLDALLNDLRRERPQDLHGRDIARALRARGFEPRSTGSRAWYERPWVELQLDLALQVAQALEHVHRQGILHRDVKPSNVMLDVHGRALLLDFGLTSASHGDRLTRSGAQIGTLLYMAPEQIGGQLELDARADVYALGATLYECLALKPPFESATQSGLQEKILAGEVAPLRARNPAVGRDAAVVCATAMEVDLRRRYADAARLASDVSNVLAHRPIEARQAGPLVVASRWVRRHPAASVGGTLGLLLLVGVPSALYVQKRRDAASLQQSLQRESAARSDASAALERQTRALAESDASLAFVGSILTGAAPAESAGLDLSVQQALELSLERIDRLAAEPRVQARVLRMIGGIFLAQGRYAKAVPPLERAVALEDTLTQGPSEQGLMALTNLGQAYAQLGRLELAEEVFQRCLAGQVALRGPEDPAVAASESFLGGLRYEQSRFAQAAQHFRRALDIYARQTSQPPESWVVVRQNLAAALVETGELEEAARQLDMALEILKNVHQKPHPNLAAAYNTAGLIAKARGRLDDAIEFHGRALELLTRLYGPDNDSVAAATFNLGAVEETSGRTDEALELYESALSKLESVGLGETPRAALFRQRIDALVARQDQRPADG